MLTQQDLQQIVSDLKPLIREAAKAHIAELKAGSKKARRAGDDKQNPIKPAAEKTPERFRRQAEKNPLMEADDLLRFEKEKRLSADAANFAVSETMKRRAAGETARFADIHKSILSELKADESATRLRFEKASPVGFSGISTKPPENTELRTYSDRITALAAQRTAAHPGSLAPMREKLANSIFLHLEKMAYSGQFIAALAESEEELPELQAIIGEIRKLASDEAYKLTMANRLIGFRSAYRQAADALRAEDQNRFHNARGDQWDRGQIAGPDLSRSQF